MSKRIHRENGMFTSVIPKFCFYILSYRNYDACGESGLGSLTRHTSIVKTGYYSFNANGASGKLGDRIPAATDLSRKNK